MLKDFFMKPLSLDHLLVFLMVVGVVALIRFIWRRRNLSLRLANSRLSYVKEQITGYVHVDDLEESVGYASGEVLFVLSQKLYRIYQSYGLEELARYSSERRRLLDWPRNMSPMGAIMLSAWRILVHQSTSTEVLLSSLSDIEMAPDFQSIIALELMVREDVALDGLVGALTGADHDDLKLYLGIVVMHYRHQLNQALLQQAYVYLKDEADKKKVVIMLLEEGRNTPLSYIFRHMYVYWIDGSGMTDGISSRMAQATIPEILEALKILLQETVNVVDDSAACVNRLTNNALRDYVDAERADPAFLLRLLTTKSVLEEQARDLIGQMMSSAPAVPA